MTQKITDEIRASIATKEAVMSDSGLIAAIAELADVVTKTLKSGGKVMFAGNGGSFADSQHLAAEFTGRFMRERDPLAALCLGANSSSISAIGNDYGYEHVFSRELRALGKPGDVFIGISTSGNSKNLLECIKAAQGLSIETFGLTGESGGEMAKHMNCIKVPSGHTARIQECHIMIGHILCEIVEEALAS